MFGLDMCTHLVDFVELGEPVEDGVHVVEHGDDLHGRDAAADLGEGDHVREQDGDALKHLTKIQVRAAISGQQNK